MITAEQLLAAGYRKYPTHFKKVFACTEGIKYSVCFEYLSASLRSDAQFKDAYGNTFNVECLTNDSIEQVEEFFESVWKNLGCKHYEKWMG